MTSDIPRGPSAAKLWALIGERGEPGADRQEIDQRIWSLFGEEWAIIFTDLSGFSRLSREFGIIHFLQVIHHKKQLCMPVIEAHDGLLLKAEADSFLIIHREPQQALKCAIAMQRACQAFSAELPAEDKVLLCAGVGWGKVLRVGDHDVFGAEVNAASKLGEDTAEPHEVLVTEAVRAAVDVDAVSFEQIDIVVPGSAVNHRASYEVWRGDEAR